MSVKRAVSMGGIAGFEFATIGWSITSLDFSALALINNHRRDIWMYRLRVSRKTLQDNKCIKHKGGAQRR